MASNILATKPGGVTGDAADLLPVPVASPPASAGPAVSLATAMGKPWRRQKCDVYNDATDWETAEVRARGPGARARVVARTRTGRAQVWAAGLGDRAAARARSGIPHLCRHAAAGKRGPPWRSSAGISYNARSPHHCAAPAAIRLKQTALGAAASNASRGGQSSICPKAALSGVDTW